MSRAHLARELDQLAEVAGIARREILKSSVNISPDDIDLWTVTVELQRQSILHLMTEFISTTRANRRMQ